MKRSSPVDGNLVDERLLELIRRVNLDGMWSREPSTVRSIRAGVAKVIKTSTNLGFVPSLPPLGPWPVKDTVGFYIALVQLDYSQSKGKNQESHLQFDSVRKLRTAASHVYEVSAFANVTTTHTFRTLQGKVFSNSSCPTQSRCFKKIMEGLLCRMGKQTKSNMGLDYKILHLMLDGYEAELGSADVDVERKRKVVNFATFFLLGFVLSLRGNEGFMIEAGGLASHLQHGADPSEETPFVLIPLLGRFKGEEGERWHLMMSVSTTASGFQVRKWIERLVMLLQFENHTVGPAFCKPDGKSYIPAEVDEEFQTQLEKVQLSHPNLIEPSLNVREWFSIFRSLRRGSTARAAELDVSDQVTNLHNRWRTTEFLKGSRSTGNMRDFYTNLRLTKKVRLKYTRNF